MTCSQVCQWWRTAALGDPQIWQNLQITLTPRPIKLGPSPIEMFSRSQDQLMALHITFPFEATSDACASVANALKPHAERLLELRVTAAPARLAAAFQPMVDIFQESGSAPKLRAIDIWVSSNRQADEACIMFPPLEYMESLVALSIHGDAAYGLTLITPRLRALRLPDSDLILEQEEVEVLIQVFTAGTTLEQWALSPSAIYSPLATWFQENATESPSTGGALKYAFWSSEALNGDCDFATLCRWTKARATNPVHFALEGNSLSPTSVNTLLLSPTRSAEDSGYIGHATGLVGAIIPHSTNDWMINVKFVGGDGETWLLPRCSSDEVRPLFETAQSVSLRLVELAIHEDLWEHIVPSNFPVLRDLTLFVEDTAALLRSAVRPPLDESDEPMVFLSIMDDPPYMTVPNLRRFRIAAFNNHLTSHTAGPMDDKLNVSVQLQHPATPVSVPAEAVTAFIESHLVDVQLPLERLVMQDIQREGTTWNTIEEGLKYALQVHSESTQEFISAGLVPFVFSRDSDLCEMYCTQ